MFTFSKSVDGFSLTPRVVTCKGDFKCKFDVQLGDFDMKFLKKPLSLKTYYCYYDFKIEIFFQNSEFNNKDPILIKVTKIILRVLFLSSNPTQQGMMGVL